MRNVLLMIRRMYSLYSRDVAILLPMLFVTAVGLIVDHIPYLNLYKDIVLLVILTADWFLILWLSRLTIRSIYMVGLGLFLLTIPLHYLKLVWYVETLANLCYIILITAVIFELKGYIFPLKPKIAVAQVKKAPRKKRRRRTR